MKRRPGDLNLVSVSSNLSSTGTLSPGLTPGFDARVSYRHKSSRKSAVKNMDTLVKLLVGLKPQVQTEYVRLLEEMGYPQMEQHTAAESLRTHDELHVPNVARILDNLRHHDAHILADGFFDFMERDHHKGRLNDAILDVVNARVDKMGFKKHNVLKAILVFPTVIRNVCQRHTKELLPEHQITLLELPRVAVDCFYSVMHKLEEKKLFKQDNDSALAEIMPSSLLSAYPNNETPSIVRQKKGILPLWCARYDALWKDRQQSVGRGGVRRARMSLDKVNAEQNRDPFIGAMVDDRYLIQQYMNHGSFAHVWKALDTQTDKHVVVKVFRGIHDTQIDSARTDVVEEGQTELRNNRHLLALAPRLPSELKEVRIANEHTHMASDNGS